MESRIALTSHNLESFGGTRIRLQRLRDSKLFSGWIVGATSSRIEARIDSRTAVDLGDEFFVQAFGDANSAMFHAKTVGTSSRSASLDVLGDPRIVASSEDMRVLIDGLKCGAKLGWFECVTDVLDVSPHGIGIRLNVAVEKGEPIELSIVSLSGEIVVRGEVRYCRKQDSPISEFRIGISLFDMDRITGAKWNRLLVHALGAPRAA